MAGLTDRSPPPITLHFSLFFLHLPTGGGTETSSSFVSARRDGLDAHDHAKRFMAYANTAASEFLYDMLWRISRVDGTVDPAEDKLLEDIALYLGLNKTVYENFKAGKKPSHDKGALKAAGVPPSLVALAR